MPDPGDDTQGRRPAALPRRNVRIFLIARFAAATAWQMQAVAVGWYVYALTDSALDLGLIGLVQFLPMAGLALPAGHIVDRHRAPLRRHGGLCDRGHVQRRAGADGALRCGQRRCGLLVIACYGVGRAFEQPSMQSWLPTLVPAPAFPRAAAAQLARVADARSSWGRRSAGCFISSVRSCRSCAPRRCNAAGSSP